MQKLFAVMAMTASATAQIGGGPLNNGTGGSSPGVLTEAGYVNLSLGAAVVTLTKPYTVAPICNASDNSAIAPVQPVVSGSAPNWTLRLNGSGSDMVTWRCTGN